MKLDKEVSLYSNFDSISITVKTWHGKCILIPKNVRIHCPIVAFSYHYEMKNDSVVLLQTKNMFCL